MNRNALLLVVKHGHSVNSEKDAVNPAHRHCASLHVFQLLFMLNDSRLQIRKSATIMTLCVTSS